MQLSLPASNDTIPSLATKRAFAEPALWPFYVSLAVSASIVTASIVVGLFSFQPMPLLSVAIVSAGLCCLGWIARWLTVYRVANLLEALGFFYASAMLTPLIGAILATSNLPLADGLLARAEPHLFFGLTRDDVAWLFHSTAAGRRIGSAAYSSLNWQPTLLMAGLFLSGRTRRAWLFLAAWFVSLGLTLIIFPFAPAISTPAHQGDAWVVVLKQVRSGELRTLSEHTLVGIVAFPSFHAAAAALLSWGFAAFGRYGIPFIVLNGVMLLSAVPAGGHYLPDLAAGIGVAVAAIRIAVKWRYRPEITSPE